MLALKLLATMPTGIGIEMRWGAIPALLDRIIMNIPELLRESADFVNREVDTQEPLQKEQEFRFHAAAVSASK
jgi:hypothetical protein